MSNANKQGGLCSCQSGLRAVRCCEADIAQWPQPESNMLLDAHATEIIAFFNSKKYLDAEALALKLLDVAPNHRSALRVLFEIRKVQKRFKAADILGARLAGLPGPEAVRGQANAHYAQYLVGRGQHEQAKPFASAALKAVPHSAAFHHVMGMVFTETGFLTDGEYHYRRALTLTEQEDGALLANLAWNLKQQGQLTEALNLYEKALALWPENQRGVGGKAQILYTQGRRDEAEALLDEAIARWPQDRLLRILRVMADLARAQPQEALQRLGAPETLQPAELLARGRAFMQLGQVVESVSAIATARTMQRERQGLFYNPEPVQARLDQAKTYFTADRLRPLPTPASDTFTPIFILGFHRCGSSLLEQLLAQLPGFAIGTETISIDMLSTHVSGLLGGGTYPEVLDNLLIGDGLATLEQLRNLYAQPRRVHAPHARFIMDRRASNVWHLGLIRLLYPHALMIHVLRHPYDLVLSNIAQDIKLEANAQMGLAGLARYYDQHAQILKHYRGQLTLRYLPVRYEDLVNDPYAEIKRIVEFTGMKLDLPTGFEANNMPVLEPLPIHFAYRENIHRRSIGRFKAYKAKMPKLFAEVAPTLDPWVRELGYEERGI